MTLLTELHRILGRETDLVKWHSGNTKSSTAHRHRTNLFVYLFHSFILFISNVIPLFTYLFDVILLFIYFIHLFYL
jgi:hypothetical protein